MEWEWDRAEKGFQRAIELDPSYSWAWILPRTRRKSPIAADPRFAVLVRGMGLYDLLPVPRG